MRTLSILELDPIAERVPFARLLRDERPGCACLLELGLDLLAPGLVDLRREILGAALHGSPGVAHGDGIVVGLGEELRAPVARLLHDLIEALPDVLQEAVPTLYECFAHELLLGP